MVGLSMKRLFFLAVVSCSLCLRLGHAEAQVAVDEFTVTVIEDKGMTGWNFTINDDKTPSLCVKLCDDLTDDFTWKMKLVLDGVPLELGGTVCDSFEDSQNSLCEDMRAAADRANNSLPKKCPVRKGEYCFPNVFLDVPDIATGDINATLWLRYEDDLIARIDVLGTAVSDVEDTTVL